MKSLKACKREIKSVMNTAGNVSNCVHTYAIEQYSHNNFAQESAEMLIGLTVCVSFFQSAPSLFLKSNFEYLRGNYRKAVKLLNSSNIAEHPGPLKTGTQCTSFFCSELSVAFA